MKSLVHPVTGVLVSGGLDSCILLAWLLHQQEQVQPFYVRTGVVWEKPELAAVRQFVESLRNSRVRSLVELELPLGDLYRDHWSMTGQGVPDARSPDEAVYLPGRNALLLIKAAVWCQLNRVPQLALAPLGTSPFADASTDFIDRFQEVINFGAAARLQISLRFAQMNKRQVMELGRELPLEHTFSCISPVNGMHCGKCNKCEERRQAFQLVQIHDPTTYHQEK